MKKILIYVFVMGMAVGAYAAESGKPLAKAADFSALAVKAADLKAAVPEGDVKPGKSAIPVEWVSSEKSDVSREVKGFICKDSYYDCLYRCPVRHEACTVIHGSCPAPVVVSIWWYGDGGWGTNVLVFRAYPDMNCRQIK